MVSMLSWFMDFFVVAGLWISLLSLYPFVKFGSSGSEWSEKVMLWR